MADLLFALVMASVSGGVGLLLGWFLLKVFSDEPLPLLSEPVIYKKVDPSTHCVRCYQRFSDWFIWSTGRRYCYPCWADSDYKIVIEESN